MAPVTVKDAPSKEKFQDYWEFVGRRKALIEKVSWIGRIAIDVDSYAKQPWVDIKVEDVRFFSREIKPIEVSKKSKIHNLRLNTFLERVSR